MKISKFFYLIALSSTSIYAQSLAPVEGFAHSFLLNKPITHAAITILETGQTTYTDANGKFGPIMYPVGNTITLELKKWGYKTTQSGSFKVPANGMTGSLHNISFQVPSLETFYLLQLMIGANLNKDYCHVVTTITAKNKLLTDCPQGIEGAEITVTPKTTEVPFYFGIFKGGVLDCKTSPFSKELKSSSLDGGAGYFNLPPSDQPYTLSARKDGVKFSKVQFVCRKGAFINISPPLGPSETKL